MLYYFSWFMALIFTDQSVYFHISNYSWNYNPVECANEASQFQHKLWENHDITVQAVVTYIYLRGRIKHLFSYFSNCFSLMDQKPN